MMATAAPDAVAVDVSEEAPNAKMLGEQPPGADEENPEEAKEEESSGCGNPLTLLPLLALGAGALFMFVPIVSETERDMSLHGLIVRNPGLVVRETGDAPLDRTFGGGDYAVCEARRDVLEDYFWKGVLGGGKCPRGTRG